jgi:hypothetical protein
MLEICMSGSMRGSGLHLPLPTRLVNSGASVLLRVLSDLGSERLLAAARAATLSTLRT